MLHANVAEQQHRPGLRERAGAQFRSTAGAARREEKAKRCPYLAQQPRVVLGEPCPVSVRGDSRILEAVLDGGGRADVLIQEFLPRLLGDGFG